MVNIVVGYVTVVFFSVFFGYSSPMMADLPPHLIGLNVILNFLPIFVGILLIRSGRKSLKAEKLKEQVEAEEVK